MGENRQHYRYILENCDVMCKMLFATEVRLLDISLGGASIITNKRLNIGGKYTLKVLTDTATLKLHSEAVWEQIFSSKKTANGDVVPLFKAGLKFNTVLTGEGNELQDFISSTMDPSQMRPRVGGIRIHVNNGPASIGTVEDVHLKNISISGMLVEATGSLEPGRKVTIELVAPGEGEAYPLLCRVISSRAVKEFPGTYELAFEFMNLGPELKARLAEFVSTLDDSVGE